MATEEESKPPSHPPYAEMIMAAIAALGEKGETDESAIAAYIESAYQGLAESHAALLTAHLARMTDDGELHVVGDNYVRPDPTPAAPPKRGRGRPPKPKPNPALTPSAAPAAPRPRGRPPKPKDPLAVAVAKAASGLPRRRGRPPKRVKAAQPAVADAGAAPSPAVVGVKRGRGRPPKVKPAVDVV
ncbi:unnamed protein product [Musa acuminata subsp. burmannicoides]